MYTIAEAAQKVGVSYSTLRFWELKGLHTAPRLGNKGIRMYTDADIAKLREIKAEIEKQLPNIAKARATREAKKTACPHCKRSPELIAASAECILEACPRRKQ